MPISFLDESLWFPPVEESEDDGLLAVGGNLSTERLLLAYRNGIFPWYNEDEIPMWWSPDPRMVLFPDELKISKSMKQVLKGGKFEFKTNTAFETVINNCRHTYREGQGGTWISDEIVAAYTQLHYERHAHCAEAWQDGVMVGGLYGLWIGKAFYGESMFSHKSNASKFAFIRWVQTLQLQRVALIDCQIYTEHLESLGARLIDRRRFITLIQKLNNT